MRTIVLGLGKSGLAVYDLLAHEGCEVVGFDDNGQRVKEVQGRKVATHVNLSDFERVIVSPGVSLQHPLVHEAKRRGLQITGEAALALSRMHERMIAVTGTNGKTTVCSLIAHVLKHAGFKVAALGNIGAPLSEYVRMGGGAEMAIVELSSYQLETLSSPLFEVGLILNITPDHLDWHGSIEAYTAAKWRLRECVKEGGEFWVHETVSKIGLTYGKNRDCTLWTDQVALYPNNMKNRFLAASALPQNSHLHSRLAHKRGPLAPDENFEAPPGQIPNSSSSSGILQYTAVDLILPKRYRELGIHESENVLAAWIACKRFNITSAVFVEALETFVKPAHRIEWVASIDGIDYIDDSKGTNLDATVKAIEAMKKPVVLIAGGVDKGAPYAVWKRAFAGRVRQVLAIGAAAEKIARDLAPDYTVEIFPTLQSAVEGARKVARAGDVVLLSPGCASFDMFRDYAHRGDEFRKIIKEMEP